ncbi:hypothetical protein FA13DRAFT_1741042 [Coprinellus micaceus]|uniref:Isoamyl alcohol oxidase n=1 Tax=Coprinellus micaceus TaxID=71717 RepID=A0A4Y7SKL9_COPMI|nr:hypothetical protein FA13DRAFT_1741042 [Coprinellus micaceus]
MIAASFLLLALLGSAQAGRNNWNRPCLSGSCYYDLPARPGEIVPSGTLKVWGAAEAIADITQAAGWEILDCNKEKISQDIRLVCTGDEAKCNHLFTSIGPVGKVVRLPESCGPAAFAHISQYREPTEVDQTVPESIERRLLAKRDEAGSDPALTQVRAVHIDTDFASADESQVGEVFFTIQAANVPGADAAPLADTDDEEASFAETQRTAEADNDALLALIQGVVDTNVESMTVTDGVQARDITFFDKSTSLGPWSVDRTFNLLDQSLTCPNVAGRLKIDIVASASALAGLGVVAQGKIIPPKVTYIGIYATLSAEVNGALILNAGLTGTVDTGKVKLWEQGIPGLSFAGILTIGPTVGIYGQASASMDVNAEVNVGLKYTVQQAKFSFPPKESGGVFELGNTPLKLSVSPSAKATGTATVHLIPQLSLGVNALGGIATASVYANIDASATANLALEASAIISNRRSIAPPSAELVALAAKSLDLDPREVSASWSGCFEILAGLEAKAGATARFLNIFNGTKEIVLFDRDWQLFRKCFGGSTRRSTWNARRAMDMTFIEKRALSCSISNSLAPLSLLSETISSASAKAL